MKNLETPGKTGSRVGRYEAGISANLVLPLLAIVLTDNFEHKLILPHIRKYKTVSWILDCMSWILDFRYWMPNSFGVEIRFRISIVSGISDSLSCIILGFKTSCKVLDTTSKNFPDSRIWLYLHGAKPIPLKYIS